MCFEHPNWTLAENRWPADLLSHHWYVLFVDMAFPPDLPIFGQQWQRVVFSTSSALQILPRNQIQNLTPRSCTRSSAIGRANIRVRHAAAGVVIVPWLELALRYEPRSSESVLLWPDSRVGAHRHLPLGAATEVHHDAGDQRIWAWRRFTLKECSRQSKVRQSKLEGHPACCRTPDAHRPMPNGHDPVAGAGISNPSPCRRRRRHRG